ncbi:MAG: A24 family peptidase [Ardenticatenaceae bacterium]|nr:A24 family peptidase [Ardenticatenaceae bacterium]
MSGYVLSLVAGWVAGAAANWAADILPAWRTEGPARARRQFDPRHDWTLWWYPFRRGHCAHCGQRRSLRAPLLEIGMMLLFALEWRVFGREWPLLLIAWAYAAFLLLVLVIDVEHRRVLNIMLAPAVVVTIAVSLLPGGLDPLNALLGGAVGFGLFFAMAILGRGALGAGDVKLAGLIGLMTGYPGVLAALFIGIVLGGSAALLLILSRRAGRKSYMPYAPYLSLGALVVLLQALK